VVETGNSVIDPRALNFENAPFREWSETPNGLSFQQEGVWSFGGWQYATWWDAEWRLSVGRRQLPDGEWESIHFSDHRLERDDIHNVAVLGICGVDGTVHLSFDHHNDRLHYRLSRPGMALDPASHRWEEQQFSPVLRDLPGADAPVESLTYPQFFESPGGGLSMYYRTGGAGNGDSHLARYEPGSETWEYLGCFISREGVYRGSATRNAYLHGIGYDRTGRLHTTWCWREGPDAKMPRTGARGESGKMSNHDLCYAYSDDGGREWMGNAGELVRSLSGPEAIRVDSPGISVEEIPMGTGLYNQVTQTVDGEGGVHAIVPREDYLTYHHYWRTPDGGWGHRKLGYGGVRPRLVSDSEGNLVLVCRGQEDGRLRVVSARRSSGWSDWTLEYATDTVFGNEPLVDLARWRKDGLLSIYLQDKAAEPGRPSALRVVTLGRG